MKTILLLDDDPKFGAAMKLASIGADCNIIRSTSIKEAEFELFSCRPDLLVVDGQLPDGDGLSWISSLRLRKCHIPAIFIAGHFRDSTSCKILVEDLRACTFLQKPISIKALNEQILAALQAEAVPLESEVLDELSQLETEFKKDLPLRMTNLLAAVSRTAKNNEDLSLLKAAITEAHRLRGTAGMYGMARFGIAIGRIEEMLLVMQKTQAEGTCFADSWTSIEKAIEDLLQVAQEESHDYSALSFQLCQRRRNILVLATDKVFTQRISNLLSSEGHLVFNFRDSVHLGEIICHMKPDLLIVSNDLQDDTLHFIRDLRTDIHALETPIAVLLNDAQPNMKEEYLSAGANLVIPKSTPNLDLLAEIKCLLKIGGEMVSVQAAALQVA